MPPMPPPPWSWAGASFFGASATMASVVIIRPAMDGACGKGVGYCPMETPPLLPTREQLIHALYEAAELEHNLMCTYLYAAFSIKDETEVDTPEEAGSSKRTPSCARECFRRWRRTANCAAAGF